jgi:hypothetical protein
MNQQDRVVHAKRWAPMHTWPVWGRWLVLGATFGLMGGGLWLMVRGSLPLRVLGVLAFAASMPLMIHTGRAFMKERSRSIERRYARGFMSAMVLYVVIMLYVWPLQKTVDAGWLKLAITLLPVLPMAWLIVVCIRYVLGSDELERRQHLEALAIGVAIVSIVSMTLGFLAASKLLVVDGSLALLLVYPALAITYGAARCWLVGCSRAQ